MPDRAQEGARVGLARRLAALAYDALALLAALLLLTLVWTAFGVGLGHRWYVFYRLSAAALVAAYFFWCWTHGGQTLGMRAWRIKLVSTRGAPFGWPAAATRAVAACLSLAAAGAGFWWALFDRHGDTWHDKLSDSRLAFTDGGRAATGRRQK